MLSNFNFSLFFKALGLALFLEGLLWALCTDKMRRAMTEMAKLSTDELRVIALGSMGAGLAVAYFLG